jgi:hypothetical protein
MESRQAAMDAPVAATTGADAEIFTVRPDHDGGRLDGRGRDFLLAASLR